MAISDLEKSVLQQIFDLVQQLGKAEIATHQLEPILPRPRPQQVQILQRLHHQGWLDYRATANQIGLTIYGKILLRIDMTIRPITPDQLLVLRSCLQGRITPQQINSKVPPNLRQALIHQLAQQKLLQIYQISIQEVWLTDAGRILLQDNQPPLEDG